ncbi:MAG: hypothetical protein KF696_04585 [Planctomycetes bacterium]|nr:hypothetical protein [Planctomycetota bacterium]MCW8134250.1 hypothetical protein [Planctomycetota bacterium]
MLHFHIFKREEIRIALGAGAATAALEKATHDAAQWMNQYAHEINVKHMSNGLTQPFAHVTVWYEMKPGAKAV